MMIAEKNAILRRQSMELLKELTEILQRIIGSGDEQALVDCGRQYAADMKVDAKTLADSTESLV